MTMLNEVFYWVLNMSAAAAITGAVVLGVRAIKSIPRRVTLFLWIIPFARMIMPLVFNSKYSLMALISRLTTRAITLYSPADELPVSMVNITMAAESYAPFVYKTIELRHVFETASIVWAVVAAMLLLTLGAMYIASMRQVVRALRAPDVRKRALNTGKYGRKYVYFTDSVPAPAVYGVFAPYIILPLSYADRDCEYILMHERAHIRGADNLKRVLAFAITAAHWFNPLAWLFLRLALADIELACDERALAKCDKAQAKQYALSLIECGARQNMFASAFGGAKLGARIGHIPSFKRITWFSALGFGALIISTVLALMTNAS